MTAEEQLKEVVKILAPEDPNQKDVVFLLMHRLTRDTQEISRLRKQRDLLEAQVNELKQAVKAKPVTIIEEVDEGPVEQREQVRQAPPKGETL